MVPSTGQAQATPQGISQSSPVTPLTNAEGWINSSVLFFPLQPNSNIQTIFHLDHEELHWVVEVDLEESSP